VSALILSSCGIFGDDKPEYYGAAESTPLDIPEHLDPPSVDNALYIQSDPMPLPSVELASMPPRITSTSTRDDDNSRFDWSAEGVYLLVEDSSDSVDRRLGLVIKRSGMVLLQPSADGNFRFEYYQRFEDERGFFSRMAFWREDAEDYSGAYKTMTRPDGENTRVYLRYADDSECEPDAAEHVLAILRERLG
jgi:uncharacterized lipoprotein